MADASANAALWRVALRLVAFGVVIALIVWMQRRTSGRPEVAPSVGSTDASKSWETEVIRGAMSAERR